LAIGNFSQQTDKPRREQVCGNGCFRKLAESREENSMPTLRYWHPSTSTQRPQRPQEEELVTDQQQQLYRALQGKGSYQELAQNLDLSFPKVRRRTHRLYQKLGINRREEL